MLQIIRTGDVVVDLGAHIGTFSLAAPAAGCKVLAVEASPHTVALLRASAAHNGFRDLRVTHAAVNDTPGTLQFCPHGPWGHVASPAVGLPSIKVAAVSIDGQLERIGWDRVAFVKMDIEGSEIKAIHGMRRLLARSDAPPLLYESNGHTLAFYGHTPGQLITELQRLGYKNYLVEPRHLIRVQANELQPQTVVNYLAVKRWPGTFAGWKVQSSMTLQERIARLAAEAKFSHEHHRAYVARALAGARPMVLSDPAIVRALKSLCSDPMEAVRLAASWWGPGRSVRPRLRARLSRAADHVR